MNNAQTHVQKEQREAASKIEDDVFAGSAPPETSQYVPWDERELSEDEQIMWDELVREEMAKMEGELREVAEREEGELREAVMLAQAAASGDPSGSSNSSSSAPLMPQSRHTSSHQFLPDSSLAGPGQRQGQGKPPAKDAPVTVLQALKARPAPEAMPVPPTFLSAIGASTRAAQNTKLTKQQEFLSLVARDEEARLEARRRQADGGAEWAHLESPAGRRVSSESERYAHVERTTREPYSSRWDSLGTTEPVAHDAAARHAAQLELKRSRQEAYRNDLAAQAEMTRAARMGVITPTLGAPRDGANPVLLPPEQPELSAAVTARRGRGGAGFQAVEEGERKRLQQKAYHEQLAVQLRAAEAQREAEAREQGQQTYRDAYTVKNVKVRGDGGGENLGVWDVQTISDSRRIPRRVQQSPCGGDVAGPSLLDNIGTHQATQAHLKRQQQQAYRRELEAASSSSAPPTERVPLKSRISGIPGQSERNIELFGGGDSSASWGTGAMGPENFASATSLSIGSVLLTGEAAERKRRGQGEYARQIAEAASARPLASPRVALKGGAAAFGGRHYSGGLSVDEGAAAAMNSSSGGGGASSVLVSGFSGLGPQTSLALRRAQQQDYKMSLERDQQCEMERISREGGVDVRGHTRSPRPRPPNEAPASTGLMVGVNLGTATRQALILQKRDEYSRELQQDARKQEIPKTYVRQQRPVSPASPRQQEDCGYWNIGTSLQVGAPTAVRQERDRRLGEEYQQRLREDANAQAISSPRRPSPRRPSQREEEASSARHNSLHLQQMEIQTAEALMAQRLQQQRYHEQLGESEEPLPHSRVPMLAIRQQNERPESFLLPGDHRAQAAYGQDPTPHHQYQEYHQEGNRQGQFGADSAGPRSRLVRAGSSEEYALHQQPY